MYTRLGLKLSQTLEYYDRGLTLLKKDVTTNLLVKFHTSPIHFSVMRLCTGLYFPASPLQK